MAKDGQITLCGMPVEFLPPSEEPAPEPIAFGDWRSAYVVQIPVYLDPASGDEE